MTNFDAEKEFNLQPPVEQAEEWHDEPDSLGDLDTNEFEFVDDSRDEVDAYEYEDDGQPSEYEEWQDVYGGDDWDHGQYDHDPAEYEWDCDLHNEF